MSDFPLNAACNSALQFFGNITASVSHEIKNVMAIINENAGLLEDYSLMAGKGIPIDPQKLISLSGKITTQIKRADLIIQNMNKFAHSVDEPIRRFDLVEMLELVTALSGRLASMREVTLDLKKPSDAITLTTHAFFLKNLVWRCLCFAMNVAGPGKTVVLSADRAGDEVVIRLSGMERLQGEAKDIRGQIGQEELFNTLKCGLSLNVKEGEIVLICPMHMNP
jgi:signal transduction histidine kinase